MVCFSPSDFAGITNYVQMVMMPILGNPPSYYFVPVVSYTSFDERNYTTGYTYCNGTTSQPFKNCINSIWLNGSNKIIYEYDSLGRLSNKYTTVNFLTSYTYFSAANGKTTPLLNTIKNGSEPVISYGYDIVGNINSVVVGGSRKQSYEYDSLNQLTRVNDLDQNKTVTYTYDNGGNITSVKEYAYTTGTLGTIQKTINYAYGNTAWKDQLTSYNGSTISYDSIGNPINYRSGMVFSWKNGRQLASVATSGSNISYTYDDNGIRQSKTIDGITTKYITSGSKILSEKIGSFYTDFFYDEAGEVYGFNYNGYYYYYFRNGQGDIIGIIDSNKSVVVKYTYDAWGNLLTTTGSLADTVGNMNPFRYRGYYYDDETGFYYCQSRYYDPTTGRFINADSQLNTSQGVLGTNVFSYCLNNPVNIADHSGHKPGELFDTMDEAAKDFANYINDKSISNNAEYASYMYSKSITITRTGWKTNVNCYIGFSWSRGFYIDYKYTYSKYTYKTKVTKYSYKEPKKGTKDHSSPPINWFGNDKKVARLHTHAAYDVAYGSGNDNFSPADIQNATKQGVPTYVATPLGTLRKYNPVDESDVVLFTDIPFDSNHPQR